MSRTGASRSAATTAASAGWRENRGRNRFWGALRSDVTASARWRRTKRSVWAASSIGPSDAAVSASAEPSAAGTGRRRERDRELERARDPVAESTFGVDRERRLTQRGTGADDRDEPAHRPDDRDGGPDDRGPLDGHEAGDGPQHQLGHEDRGQREPGPSDDPPDPEPAAMGGEAGPDGQEHRIERAVDDRRADRPARRRPRPPGTGDDGLRASDPHAAASLGARRGRCGRQRRVGDTSWIETNRKMTERISQVATLFGQNVSRRPPNGSDVVDRTAHVVQDRPRRRRPSRATPGRSRTRPTGPRRTPWSTTTTPFWFGTSGWVMLHHVAERQSRCRTARRPGR